jgi:hypothetical protein
MPTAEMIISENRLREVTAGARDAIASAGTTAGTGLPPEIVAAREFYAALGREFAPDPDVQIAPITSAGCRASWCGRGIAGGDTLGAVLAGQLRQFYAPPAGSAMAVTSSDARLISVPCLCLNDSSDAADLIDSAARAIASPPNLLSPHRVFTPQDGTSGYRELDNFYLKHRAMFDWLDETLGRAATPAAATGALKMP